MRFLILSLFILASCDSNSDDREKLLPEIKNRITCEKFLSKITQKLKDRMQCETYPLKDLDLVMPTNCGDKTEVLDRICRYMLNEMRLDIYKWNCKRLKPLNEKDKDEICSEFIKADYK